MNTTEYTTFMVPNSDELQQLSELYKATTCATDRPAGLLPQSR